MLASACGNNMYITTTRECTNTSCAGSDMRWSLYWTLLATQYIISMNNVIVPITYTLYFYRPRKTSEGQIAIT